MRKPLPPEIRAAGWISFFTDVASEMAYPVIPLFIVGALQAPAWVLGLIEGSAQALINVMRAVSGWHSDKIGKRTPYIRLGYGVSALSRPILGLATGWGFVFFARMLDRFGKGVRTTARDALIGDIAPKGEEGRAFGFHRAMDSAGAVLGSSIGWLLLLVLPGQYRLIFLVTAVPAAIAVWITFRLKEPEAPKPVAGAVSSGKLSAKFWLATAVMCLFALANSSDTFLLLRAKDLGFSIPNVALLYVLFNITYSVLSYPFGTLSDRVGKTPLLVGGWLVYAVVYFGFAGAPAWTLWIGMPLYGLYMAMTDGVSKALVSTLSPGGKRGSAMGTFYFLTGTSGLVASLLAGWLWDAKGHDAPFLLGAWIAVASVVLAVIVLPFATQSPQTA